MIKRLPDKNKKKLYQKPLFENYLRGYGEDNYMRGNSLPVKNSYSKNIKNKVSDLMILKNDTSNVIEFNSSFSEDIKENKPRSFWKLFNKQ